MWRMTTEIFNHLKEGGNRINKRKGSAGFMCLGLGEPGNYFLAAFSVMANGKPTGSSEKFPMKFLHLYVILLQEKQR